jgi:hypothetical protein
MSRAIAAAGTRQPAIRSARFLGLGARALASGVRWAWQPDADADADAKDRRALRGLYVAYGALIGIAVLLTTGAVRGSDGGACRGQSPRCLCGCSPRGASPSAPL